MIDFIAEISDFIAARRKALVRKLLLLGAAAILVVVLLGAMAVALSKIILPLLLILIVAAGVWLGYRGIRWWEWDKLRTYVRDILKKLRNLIADKERELWEMRGDPAECSLLDLLRAADPQEREALEKFTGKSFESPEEFEEIIRRNATHQGRLLVKMLGGSERRLALADYGDMLDLAGAAIKLERKDRSDAEFEREIVRCAFDMAVGRMNAKDRKALERKMGEYADRFGKRKWDVALTATGLTAAHLGGFSTYMLASSLLSAVSSSLGLGLGIGAYYGMSSALSVVIGPAGWAAWGAYLAHKLVSPDKRTTFLVVLVLASIRARLLCERDERREELSREIAVYKDQEVRLREWQAALEQKPAALPAKSPSDLPPLAAAEGSLRLMDDRETT